MDGRDRGACVVLRPGQQNRCSATSYPAASTSGLRTSALLPASQRWRRISPTRRCSSTFSLYRDDRGRIVSRQCLRKTFGTHLAATEPNISVVAKLMRHSTPTLTLRLYEDARLMDLRGAVDRINGGDGSTRKDRDAGASGDRAVG